MGNVTEYDARRPRIPVALGAAIDDARGQVSYNRFVVSRLADALGVELSEVMRAAAPKDPPKAKTKKRVTPPPEPDCSPDAPCGLCPGCTDDTLHRAARAAAPKPKAAPKTKRRRALTSAEAKAGVLGRDKALAAVQQKHAARRASQRRDKS